MHRKALPACVVCIRRNCKQLFRTRQEKTDIQRRLQSSTSQAAGGVTLRGSVSRRACAGSVLRVRLELIDRPHAHRRSPARGVPPRVADAVQGLSFVPPCQHRPRHTRHPHHHCTTTSHCRPVETLRGPLLLARNLLRNTLCGHPRSFASVPPLHRLELNLGRTLPLARRPSASPPITWTTWRDPCAVRRNAARADGLA